MKESMLELADLQIADRQRESADRGLARLAGNRRPQSPKLMNALRRITWTRRRPSGRAA